MNEEKAGILVIVNEGFYQRRGGVLFSNSVEVFHQDPTHENWQKMLDETDYLTLDPIDYNIWDLLFDMVLLAIDDKLIALVKEKYYTEYPDKADIVERWLLDHKGKVIYHHTWEF